LMSEEDEVVWLQAGLYSKADTLGISCDGLVHPLNKSHQPLDGPQHFFFQEKISQIYIWYKFLYKTAAKA